jgi:chemotaxis protein MotB
MAAASNEATIIIKKKKRKGGHDGHHSSAWKVAYADFVTAMMAFFLLLWLLSVTTDDQRRGIADYFDPGAVAESTSGSGGVLGGLTIGQPGQLSSPSSRFSQHRSLPGTPNPAEDSNTLDEHDGSEPGSRDGRSRYEFDGNTTLAELRETLNEEELALAIAEWEEQQFEEASAELRQAMQSVPELERLADNLIVEQAPEGLRIQIVDQARVSMFPIGSSNMYDRTQQLLEQVAQAIGQMPNRISISGHTDATPYATGRQYDNWDLSVDRANASRRALLESGIDPERIATVIGLADTDLMFPHDPTSPRNRRISIVLLREAPAPPSEARREAAAEAGDGARSGGEVAAN